ncbi:glycosyltransferase family 4 protein [Psychrobacter maritimus]|uniref:glycosyltransferase family 4 protein n=1 Tax=Psychrobacter maritimus TaxID=256325 RepID=UPI00248B1FF9|nr:glycosyltransferase family 4 protein [Psychrobacter sp. WB2]WGV12263.1 glycosyltransferase family 4 protein [Psychrobacter sp. WB2]
MSNKLNIVFICNEYPPGKSGGIGVFTKKIAEGLCVHGHDVHVIGTYPSIENKLQEEVNKVKVIRIPHVTGRIGLIANRVAIYKHLKKIALIKPIDIIECPDFEASISYIPKLAKSSITRLHGSHTYFSSERNMKPSAIIKHLEEKQLKSASDIVSVSQYTAEETKRLFGLPENPWVIYNSIDVDSFKAYIKIDYSESKKVIYFGSLSEKKGIYPLAEAWRSFSLENPDWVLSVVGKDTYENGYSSKEEMIKILGETKGSIEFIDHIDNKDLIKSLRNYDFAILPSFSEAFALAPLEAMAVGLPVIISNMSSGPELVEHGVDGWLCDPRKPKTILNMIELVVESERLRESIAKAAIEKIKNKFNFQCFIESNINMYKYTLTK